MIPIEYLQSKSYSVYWVIASFLLGLLLAGVFQDEVSGFFHSIFGGSSNAQ